jgi:hypothetical protein
VFGGGRNQENGTECFDGWGGSARQGDSAVDTAEMGDERRRRKGISVAIVRRRDL